MDKTMLPIVEGLLIEGVDYAGKTAVTDALMELMLARRYKVYRRACFMHEHPIIDALLALAKTSDRMDVRDTCYTSSLLLDLSMPPLPAPAGYLLQERHVPTQIARNTFFYDDAVRWEVDVLTRLRRRFSSQVYLTSTLATKRTRTRTRAPKSPRDALLAGDPVLHQRFDDFSREQLPTDEDWLIIDTSSLSVAQISHRILDHIESHGVRVRHAGL